MVKLVIHFNLFWKLSPVIVLVLLMIGLFLPMGWGAPTGPALIVRNSVPIVPDVAGEVIDVPVEPNRPLKAGDMLFKIDPAPSRRRSTSIPHKSNAIRPCSQRTGPISPAMSSSRQRNAASRQQEEDQKYLVDQDQANIKLGQALLAGAQWNLDKTIVRAPADGYVTNLALRKGARVASLPMSPVMAFIDVSDTIMGIEIQQINARYIESGQEVEVTFKFLPGRVLTGKVVNVLQAVSTGQVQASGLAVTPKAVQSAPFVVRVQLDDAEIARSLPAGTAGDAAIYTDHVKASHIIRKVLLRQIAITNYVNPL